MSSSRDALRRQRRRELDAKRSKSRVRLGASLQSWGQLKERLGFTLHSELAQYLLESYFSRVCVKCSAGVREGVKPETLVTSADSLQHLVLLVHRHSQQCPFPPTLHAGAAGNGQTARGDEEGVVGGEPSQGKKEGCSVGLTKEQLASQPLANVLGQSGDGSATALDLRYTCDGGHLFSWCPYQTGREGMSEGVDGFEKGGGAPVELNRSRERGRRGRKRAKKQAGVEGAWSAVKAGRCSKVGLPVTREGSQQPEEDQGEEEEVVIDLRTTEIEENRRGDECGQEVESETGSDTMLAENLPPLGDGQLPDNEEKDMNTARHKHKNGGPALKRDSTVVLPTTTRGRRRKEVQSAADRGSPSTRERENRRTARGLTDDDISQIGGKRKRKATPRDILPCEFVGCGKIFSTRQYLNHHMKYQHVQQKTFACSHPACGKSFNFKKHLKEHEKLHSNQRDYICEFCARAFRTSSNLIIHRRIHTGEKPLQCEVCGFTCRQKASLNWHMRKHDAESGYQFPCEICGRRFEKRDNVTAHRSKSHPDRATSPLPSRG